MQKPHIPGALISAFNAKQQKAAMPPKGETGLVMKRKHAAKRKGSADVEPSKGFGAADDLHEEKRSKKHKHMKRKGACKSCSKTACKHMKRKNGPKA